MSENEYAAPPPAVQAAIDDVLTTHGAYVPVELLLALGRLRYTDYEAWRCGERPSLQSALAGNPRRVLALLESAARWARRLGLSAEREAYFGWGANAHERLSFLDPEWHASEPLLDTHYVRPAPDAAGGGQFDLFLDSGATAALADLRAALRARDRAGAERALATLGAREPAHHLRLAAERLTDALAHLETALPPGEAGAELRALEQSLLPAARDVLGAAARDFLAPFWQRLAAALAGAPFDPERPTLHASYAHARCLDWPRAIAAIEDVHDHTAEPALLARLAEARHRDRDRVGAIAAWCRLCFGAPEAAREALDASGLPDARLRETWLAFLDLEIGGAREEGNGRGDDVGPAREQGHGGERADKRGGAPGAEADVAFFPAYALLAEPGLATRLPDDLGRGEGPGEGAFRATRELLRADDVDARRALQAAAPWLLDVYLRSGTRER